MRSYKKIMPLLLVGMLLLTVVYSIQNKTEIANTYETALTQARDYAQKGIVTDAMAKYATAMSAKPSAELSLEAGAVYVNMGDYKSAEDWYEGELLKQYPKDSRTYLYGIQVYLTMGNYREAYRAYDDYRARELYLEDVEKAMDQIRYEFDLKGPFQEVSPFSNVTNTAAVKYQDAWGYVDASGSRKIRYIFREAQTFGNLAAVITKEGRAIYIDGSGNEKINENFLLETDPDFGQVEKFAGIQSNLILAYNGKIWNYYQMGSYEKLTGGYAGAWPITLGVGAVSQDGSKWALISSEGKRTTDFVFDEVVADAKDVICRTGAVVVRQGEEYLLVDQEGRKIGKNSYEKAKAFCDTSLAAVQKSGKWIFVDEEGQELVLGEYEDVQSFSNGLAAVKQDGKWGYIDQEGKLVIACQFLDAGPFHSTGVAFVKTDEQTWKLLSLYIDNHD